MSEVAVAVPDYRRLSGPPLIERISRAIVIMSAIASSLMTPLIVERLWVGGAVLVTSYIAGLLWGRRSTAAFLLTFYVFPAVVVLTAGTFDAWRDSLWKITFLGLILGRMPLSKWSMPRAWTITLGIWALTIALCWPVVWLREMDFAPSFFARGWYSIAIVGWVVSVASTQLIGLLWVDSLFARDIETSDWFHQETVLPLLVSAFAAGLLAVVQLFWNMTFVNTRQFGYLRRASGGMMDANAYGVIAAMWVCGGLAVAMDRTVRQSYRVFAGIAAAICALGCWASGSRTALLALIVALVWIFYCRRETLRSFPRVRYAAAAAVGLALIVVVITTRSLAVGPAARISDLMTYRGSNRIVAVLNELWNRNWYGTIALAMIKQFPLVGIGIGSFHSFSPRYADLLGHGPLPPDNAQNWFRHQLAEFGLLGSIGWIAWAVLFLGLLLRLSRGGAANSRVAATGALFGLAAASLLGMPTQNTATLLTFWTFVFWVVQDATEKNEGVVPWPRWEHRALLLGSSLAIICAVGTAYVGWQELRPPLRGLHLGFDYSYGFYENDPNSPDLRWAATNAVVVMSAPKPWIRVRFSARNHDIADHPVDVRVMRDTKLAMKAHLTDAATVTMYLQVPDGHRRIMLETSVSHPLRPEDVGARGDRDLGLLVGWEFVDRPGLDGITIAAPRVDSA